MPVNDATAQTPPAAFVPPEGAVNISDLPNTTRSALPRSNNIRGFPPATGSANPADAAGALQQHSVLTSSTPASTNSLVPLPTPGTTSAGVNQVQTTATTGMPSPGIGWRSKFGSGGP
jgi:hypothetical protein